MADRAGFIAEKDIADFAQLMRDYRAGRLHAKPDRATPVNPPGQRWIPCVNTTNETIPAYGVVAVINAQHLGDTQTLLSVGYQGSATDNYTGTLAINGSAPIGPYGRGLVTFDSPTWARLNSATVASMEIGATVYCGPGGYEFYHSAATSTYLTYTVNAQLLSEPVPVSGGYIGLINLIDDDAYAFSHFYPPAFSSGATGYLGLASSSSVSSGVQIDHPNDKLIFRKNGHYHVRCAINILLGYGSSIDFTPKVYNAAGELHRAYSNLELQNQLSADNISGGTMASAVVCAAVYAAENYYFRLEYECQTSGTFSATMGADESSVWVQRCG